MREGLALRTQPPTIRPTQVHRRINTRNQLRPALLGAHSTKPKPANRPTEEAVARYTLHRRRGLGWPRILPIAPLGSTISNRHDRAQCPILDARRHLRTRNPRRFTRGDSARTHWLQWPRTFLCRQLSCRISTHPRLRLHDRRYTAHYGSLGSILCPFSTSLV